MSFRLQEQENLQYGVRRIAIEEIDDALAHLDAPEQNLDDAVHESRKSFKKIHGLLRLVRLEIGEIAFKRENICFRDAGRLLSDLRDSRVMIATANHVVQNNEGTIDEQTFTKLLEELEEKYAATRHRVVEEEQGLAEAALMIRTARTFSLSRIT